MGEPWMPEEDATLREMYPTFGPRWDGWAFLLSGRSRRAISQRALCIGVRYEGPCKSHDGGTLDGTDERAVAAVAALGEWDQARLALLVETANVREEWTWTG